MQPDLTPARATAPARPQPQTPKLPNGSPTQPLTQTCPPRALASARSCPLRLAGLHRKAKATHRLEVSSPRPSRPQLPCCRSPARRGAQGRAGDGSRGGRPPHFGTLAHPPGHRQDAGRMASLVPLHGWATNGHVQKSGRRKALPISAPCTGDRTTCLNPRGSCVRSAPARHVICLPATVPATELARPWPKSSQAMPLQHKPSIA
jgi:hypothetical protein